MCLLLNALYFGGEAYLAQNAVLLETLALLAAGAAVLWRLVRYQPQKKPAAVCVSVVYTLLVLAGAWCYHEARHSGLWVLVGGCAVLSGLFWLTRKQYHNQRRRVSLLLLGTSFLLKFFYVCYTPITRRQHDVGKFGDADNHAGYITYLLQHHQLPDFDPRGHWQFYHPPLHHMISALWLWLSEHVFGISNAAAQESLQTLSLFYAMAIVITAYRILRHFRLEGMALYVPLAVVAFHPGFILFSGSINNDALSVVFILGAVLWTLKWYEKQTWGGHRENCPLHRAGHDDKAFGGNGGNTGGGGLSGGAGTAAAAEKLADPRAVRRICSDLFPAGTVVSGAESGAVRRTADLCAGNAGKLCAVSGEQSFFSRILDFSPHQVASVFEQWVQRTGGSYNEYNPLIALLKNAMFGEYINEYTLDCSLWRILTGVVLFWLNVVLAAAAFAAMLWLCGKREQTGGRLPKLFLVLFYAVLMGGFYQLSAAEPLPVP